MYNWIVGITTTPERRADLLPQTLTSLKLGGFDSIRLFVDGADTVDVVNHVKQFGLDHKTTFRHPRIGAFGNWLLALSEMWIRSQAPRKCPKCDSGMLVADHCNNMTRRIGTCTYHEPSRFAIFQDDLCCVKNLRQYLEQVTWPNKGYLNLYTFLRNEQVIAGQPTGWYEAIKVIDREDGPRYQAGYGALALVFTREAVQAILTSPVMWNHAAHSDFSNCRIDPKVCEALNEKGWRQYVHNPSLVRHTGLQSVIRTLNAGEPKNCPYPPAHTYPNDQFDALTLLKPRGT